MSEPLQWAAAQRYFQQAGDYTICKIGSARGWTFEVWKQGRQLKVALTTASDARRWAQRHHDRHKARENHGDVAHTEPA